MTLFSSCLIESTKRADSVEPNPTQSQEVRAGGHIIGDKRYKSSHKYVKSLERVLVLLGNAYRCRRIINRIFRFGPLARTFYPYSCLGHSESHHTNKNSNRSGDDWPGEWYKIDVAGGVN